LENCLPVDLNLNLEHNNGFECVINNNECEIFDNENCHKSIEQL